jgi:hypothetical protein
VASGRFGFAIAHNAASHKIWIVEDRAVSMCQRVAQFSAFVWSQASQARRGWVCLRGRKTA